jgi:hypothetical protein
MTMGVDGRGLFSEEILGKEGVPGLAVGRRSLFAAESLEVESIRVDSAVSLSWLAEEVVEPDALLGCATGFLLSRFSELVGRCLGVDCISSFWLLFPSPFW